MKMFLQAAHIARKFLAVASLLTVTLLSGCASFVKGSVDAVHVTTRNCGEAISCKATNNKGEWDFTAPGSVRFYKSENSLTVTCQNSDETLTQKVAPTPGGWIWGNLFLVIPLGFPMGFFFDAVSDSHWNMVDTVTLNREYCRGKKTGQ
ncbi:MAG: hypothetical protein OD918_03680 [Gammaproteobacteria bacterium]